MGKVIQFVKKEKTESTEELIERAIGMFERFKNNISNNFLNVPKVMIEEPRKEGWQTYLILHLNKIGYSTPDALNVMSDDTLVEAMIEDAERIRLLQWTFMRKHFDDSILPSTVPKIKSIN